MSSADSTSAARILMYASEEAAWTGLWVAWRDSRGGAGPLQRNLSRIRRADKNGAARDAAPSFRNVGAGLRLLHFELDLLQDAGFFWQLGGPGRELVGAEHEREDVRVLLAAQRARRVLRHRNADALEQVADREAVPAGHEFTARQGRRHLAAGQLAAVARRAHLRVKGFAARGLFLAIDAVPDGFRGRLRMHGGMQYENRRERNECRSCDVELHESSSTKRTAFQILSVHRRVAKSKLRLATSRKRRAARRPLVTDCHRTAEV